MRSIRSASFLWDVSGPRRPDVARFCDVNPTDVYTDGACKGNPGPGGWAWVVPDGGGEHAGVHGSGGAEQTTNQRMELEAVLRAVEAIDGALRIHSDSTYVVNCFNDRWYEGWLKRGWKNAQKKPVANKDLWEPLIEHYLRRSNDIEFIWVKGHAGNVWNERADVLAVAAAEAVVEAVGIEAAAGPKEAAAPGSSAPWPAGRALWVTGTGQPDQAQLGELERVVNGLDPAADLVISGLRRGVELAAAELARSRRIEIGVVLPFVDPASKWPPNDRDRFDTAVAAASYVVELEGDPSAPGAAVVARNQWVLGHVIGVVSVADPDAAAAAEAADLTSMAIE